MAHQGFNAFNSFKSQIKELKQIYDLTIHLYIEEHKRLQTILSTGNTITFTTQVGLTDHTVSSLYQLLESTYPNKLRQLILISSITALEVFLTDLVAEISKRDLTPFEENAPIEFFKNQILNTPSIKVLHETMISKDVRNLSSGGFQEVKKYYWRKFKIDFNTVVPNIKEIEETHSRRHLHVHRNGICDSEYSNKYPAMGFNAGDKINITHSYLVKALQNLSNFASGINKEVTHRYPEYTSGYKTYSQPLPQNSTKQKLLLEIKLTEKNFDIETYLRALVLPKHKLIEYISQISTKGRNTFLILYGEKPILSKFFVRLKNHDSFILESVMEIRD